MIVVTAATGTTGRTVVSSLVRAGHEVRGASRRDPGDGMAEHGVVDFVAGDLVDPAVAARAVDGVDTVVHIGPPFHPRETDIGHTVLSAARRAGIRHFVQFSTMRPQLEPLLNHQSKLALERLVISSPIPFTILQPVHYMQNIEVRAVVADVAQVAAEVVGKEEHFYATYELCGADRLTGRDIARTISEVSGTSISAQQSDSWLASTPPRRDEQQDFKIDSLRRLFDHYGRYGITGNPRVLEWLLGRPPTSFRQYVSRWLA